ncbi:MAG: cytochrome b/b6 domain-containing protein [Coriobacteriales bacterium]|jgi:formate dehydrogenase subunit gamma|nr:cytochrome b/b6 domain-containing protein [Coriobacteriales bacterium]
MTRYIKRHTLQTRITHDVTVIACILLAISGLFVFVPALNNLLPSSATFAIRMAHRVLGIVFIAVPLISAILAPKGVKHLLSNYFARWDKDDVTFIKRFLPYMLGPKRVHMPDQHEVKSGQRLADGVLFLAGFLIAISGVFLLVGTTFVTLDAGLMLFMRLAHDVAFVLFAVFGIAHIYLGAGVFQPYRRMGKTMFGNGMISESDALYHWGHWARETIEKGDKVVEVEDKK